MGDRIWSAVVAMAVCGTVCGCGRDAGPTRYNVSGEVTFNGNPVPAGHVLLTPNAASGNQGPQGFAPIRGGQFTTAGAEGKGAGSGAYRIEIHGSDGVPYQGEEREVPEGRMLFPTVRENVTLPARDSSLAIAVSSSGEAGAQATVEVLE